MPFSDNFSDSVILWIFFVVLLICLLTSKWDLPSLQPEEGGGIFMSSAYFDVFSFSFFFLFKWYRLFYFAIRLAFFVLFFFLNFSNLVSLPHFLSFVYYFTAPPFFCSLKFCPTLNFYVITNNSGGYANTVYLELLHLWSRYR